MPLPTQNVTLSKWTGINAFDPPDEMTPNFLADGLNIDFDEAGVIEKRRGATRKIALSGTINLIYDWQAPNGFWGLADKQRTVIVAGATIYIVRSLEAGGVVDASFATVNALHYACTNSVGLCFISHENGGAPPKFLWMNPSDGIFRFTSAAFDPPTVDPSVSFGTTGSGLVGIYRFRYTYQDYWGNETNPSEPSPPLDVQGDQFPVVGVTASPDPSVQFINIYCLPPQGAIYQYAQQVANTTGNYIHAIPDATVMGSAALEYDHYVCPFAKYVTIFNDMLCVAGEEGLADTVYVSNSRYHRQFAVATDWARAVTGDGQAIKGFSGAFNQLIVGKADSIFVGDGTDNTTFNLRPHNQNYGVLGQPSMTFINQRLSFFSDDGVYEDDSIVPTELSIPIRNQLRQLNPGNLANVPPKQYCANYKYYKQVFWCVRKATGVGPNDRVLVWNYERKAWSIWSGNAAVCLGPVQDPSDYEMMYGGDSAGNVFLYQPPNGGVPNDDSITGSSVAISAFAETPWLNLPRLKGVDDWERCRTIPKYLSIYVSGESDSGTVTMTSNYFLDFDMTIRGTFSTTHTALAWPQVLPKPKMITPWGGPDKLFSWCKWRFTNNNAGEHFKIHKLIFGFKVKPAID